jgi:hypothetical protein
MDPPLAALIRRMWADHAADRPTSEEVITALEHMWNMKAADALVPLHQLQQQQQQQQLQLPPQQPQLPHNPPLSLASRSSHAPPPPAPPLPASALPASALRRRDLSPGDTPTASDDQLAVPRGMHASRGTLAHAGSLPSCALFDQNFENRIFIF